ncbi:hyaluronidase-2-like [Pseudophryne corroboree]|uniref:hyaluronidase-2-like n=1 Tax=Pseudophryne corroboree TaxID=495146 RepID=UPI003081996C
MKGPGQAAPETVTQCIRAQDAERRLPGPETAARGSVHCQPPFLTMLAHVAFPYLLVGCLLIASSKGQSPSTMTDKPTVRPVFSPRPFMVAWNAPTQDCWPRFEVPYNLSLFDLNATPNQGFVNQSLTIFYKERLGFYPYYDDRNVSINGGVPQNASLRTHLNNLQEDISRYIRVFDKDGLAVIDWEEWRPIWIRNWKSKDVYRQASRQLVSSRHPDWTADNVSKQAQYEFENAARDFMEKTLHYSRNFAPRQMWGYYLFPDCYNHDYLTNWDSYTGRCPDVEMSRNDQLSWLWEESTALYPSIYLDPSLKSSANGRKFVHYRVKEAMRIAYKHHRDYSVPVFVYTRPTYIKNMDLLSELDLISTIGESAAQGAAGAIFWGDAEYSRNRDTCKKIKNYVDEDLGRYIVNVTTAAQHCSQTLCSGNGRCLRQENNTDAFLHLNPANFRIVRRPTGSSTPLPLWADGRLSTEDVLLLRSQFRCQCYVNWYGGSCAKERLPKNSGAGSVGGHAVCWSLLAFLWMLL